MARRYRIAIEIDNHPKILYLLIYFFFLGGGEVTRTHQTKHHQDTQHQPPGAIDPKARTPNGKQGRPKRKPHLTLLCHIYVALLPSLLPSTTLLQHLLDNPCLLLDNPRLFRTSPFQLRQPLRRICLLQLQDPPSQLHHLLLQLRAAPP